MRFSVDLLISAVVGLAIGALLRRRSRRTPPPPAPRKSIAVELVEAPGSRPVRYCARCGRSVMKQRDGDAVWIRIEDEEIHYLHRACATERGDRLP